jgi:AmmeMemoRadiSam system protein A
VGYGSVILTSGAEPVRGSISREAAPPVSDAPLNLEEKRILLNLARTSLRRFITTRTIPLAREVPARLTRMQGAFVTLKKRGHLRGCIGHMAADQSLAQTVAEMTVHAAVKDPRFKPVALEELKEIEIEISALTPWQPIARAEDIVIGRDGVVFLKGGQSAVFLPQVAVENGWDYPEMLDNLCLKAGLPKDSWKEEGARFFVFQADVFSEAEFH